MIRVLIADDHPIVRAALRRIAEDDRGIAVTGEVASGAVRALRGGAAGYLTKDHSPDQLLDAIRRVHRGGRYVSPTLAERLAAQLGEEFVGAPHERLTDREFDVLRGLGAGCTVIEIARELGLSPKT